MNYKESYKAWLENPYFDEDNQFTKQEIDSMETGSYEQIEVAE